MRLLSLSKTIAKTERTDLVFRLDDLPAVEHQLRRQVFIGCYAIKTKGAAARTQCLCGLHDAFTGPKNAVFSSAK
jgi:hypothetical protein